MAIYVGNKRYSLYVGDKRRRYMGGASSLPYDAEIEYLESTMVQYINLGVTPQNTDTEYYIEYECPNQSNAALFGSSTNNRYWSGIPYYNSIGSNRLALANTYNQGIITETVGVRYSYKLEIFAATKTFTATSSNGQVLNGSYTGTYSDSYNIYLYAHNNSNSVTARIKTKVYKFSYKINGVYIRDMIPVRIGNTGYMYDKVSGQLFGNAGTGDFVLGPDKN